MIKLYRNDADITSIEAAESVDINKMEKIVFECIDSFGKSMVMVLQHDLKG